MSLMGDIHRITVDEYQQMAEAGDWERVELIDGIVYDLAWRPMLHGAAKVHIYEVVKPWFPNDIVLFDATVRLSDFTAVDPDVLVVDGSVALNQQAFLPASVVTLVVEVSRCSEGEDLGRKLQAYAEAGIPQYWVVDPRPEAGYLLRHTEPRGSGYARTLRYEVGEGAKLLDAAAVLAGEF